MLTHIHTIPYHTIPYKTIRDYAYHTTIHTTRTIHMGSAWQPASSQVLQFQTSSFSQSVCVSRKMHVGILYLSAKLRKCKNRSLSRSCCESPGVLFIIWRWKFQNRPRMQTNPNDVRKELTKTNRAIQ